jgi:hypothetical protein
MRSRAVGGVDLHRAAFQVDSNGLTDSTPCTVACNNILCVHYVEGSGLIGKVAIDLRFSLNQALKFPPKM